MKDSQEINVFIAPKFQYGLGVKFSSIKELSINLILKTINISFFFYDKEGNRIGFRFTSDEKEEGLIKISINKNGMSISARSFLQYHDIPYKENKKYDIDFDEESKLHVAYIGTGIRNP